MFILPQDRLKVKFSLNYNISHVTSYMGPNIYYLNISLARRFVTIFRNIRANYEAHKEGYRGIESHRVT